MHHYKSPCIHCGQEMEDVKPGQCRGDASKAVPLAYRVVDRRWDGVEHYRIRFSDGRVEERHAHASFRLPYYHFGHSDELVQPPRYDPKV